MERPSEGEVWVNGQNLMQLSNHELAQTRTHIGMIFQHFNLLSSRTVFENIALPLELIGTPKAAIRSRVNELIALVGLQDKENTYPANLSGGQKQRVAIARTLVNNPKVLLCDEATSALDPATTTSILALLKDINKRLGITILLITHEMEVVKSICDEVAIISAGKLIEQGSVGNVFSNPQTAIAKEFIASTIKINLPSIYADYLKQLPTENSKPIIKLLFNGQSANEPVVSEASQLLV